MAEWQYEFNKKGVETASDKQLAVWNFLYVTEKFNTSVAPKIVKELRKRQGAMDENTGLPWQLPVLTEDEKGKLKTYLETGEQTNLRNLDMLTKVRG